MESGRLQARKNRETKANRDGTEPAGRPGPVRRYRQKSREEYSAGDSIHKKTRQRRKPRRGRPGANDGGETANGDGDGGFRDHSCRKGMRAASERARNQSGAQGNGTKQACFYRMDRMGGGQKRTAAGPGFICLRRAFARAARFDGRRDPAQSRPCENV